MNNKILTKQDLIDVLLPWQQRIKLQRAFVWFMWGLAGAIVTSAILVSLGDNLPLNLLWAGLAILIGPAVCVAYGTLKTPSLGTVALHLDRLLALSDRTATAWEMREAKTPISLVQRADALVYIKNNAPKDSISLWPGRPPFVGLLIALVVPMFLMLATLFLGILNKPDETFHRQLNNVQEELIQVRESIPSQGEEVNPVATALEEVAQSLESSQNREEALEQLARAEKSLEELLEPAASQQVQELQDFAQMLSADERTAELGNSLLTGSSDATIKALEQMTREIRSLSEEDRNSLATVFGTKETGDQQATFQEEIDGVASALFSGEFAKVAESLGELGRKLVETQETASTQKAARGAQEAIIRARNDLSETVPVDQIAGLGVGEGRGGNEPGTSIGNQSGRLSNIPPVGEERLFIPGRGSDVSRKIGNAEATPTSEVQMLSYQEVLSKYSEEARKHMQQSPIPLGYKELIRRYFLQLAEEEIE